MSHKAYTFEAMRKEFLEALKDSISCKNVDVIHKVYLSIKSKTDAEKRSALDQVLRDYLLTLRLTPQPVSVWEIYLSLCIEACRREMVTTTMTVVLLGDIFDGSTLECCEQLFKFVERNVFIWKEDMFFSACKNNLLRMCNDLLRRLSRSQDKVFCGRILLFLAKFFPFSERSGLNIVSEFNLENITEFSGDETLDVSHIEDKEDAVSDGKSDKLKIDYNLYTKFWALQDFFRNPNQCYTKVQWRVFCNHTAHVLAAFKSCKLEDDQSKRGTSQSNKQEDSQKHYFAKFLTNQKLLELQFGDSNFRRSVLVQFLILFQYLNSPVKFKQDSYELKPDQMDFIKETTQQVYSLLEETPPDGIDFTNAVKHILLREEHWNNWKNEGCPVFQKPVLPADEVIEDDKKQRPVKHKKRLGDMFRDAHSKHNYIFGKVELSRLWNRMPDNLEACKGANRDFLPSLESYFEEAIEQTDPEAMVEDQYKRVKDGNFGWRALRLLARKSPHFFAQNNNYIARLDEYLESMVKKMAKEKPEPSAQNNDQKQDGMDLAEAGLVKEVVGEEEEEEELLKTDEIRNTNMRTSDDTRQNKLPLLVKKNLPDIAAHIANNWKTIAEKLGCQPDEIDFFAEAKETDILRAQHMLDVWSDECDEASLREFTSILESFGLNEAAEMLKV